MLIHQIDVLESCEAPLIDTERYLRETCKEYYIDYDTCECKARPVTEGLVSGLVNLIKTIFQKAIAFLVKIWKAIVDFVKTIFKKAIEFFKRLLGIKTNKKVEMKVGLIMDPLKPPQIVKTSSPQESQGLFKKAFQAINQLIQKTSQQNISLTKRYESKVVSSTHESYIPQSPIDFTVATEKEVHNKQTWEDDTKTSEYIKNKSTTSAADMLSQVLPDDLDQSIKDRIIKMYSATSYQGSTLSEHISVQNINFIDMKRAKEIVVAENLNTMLLDLLNFSYAKYYEKYTKKLTDAEFAKQGGYQTTLNEYVNWGKQLEEMKQLGIDPADINQYVAGQFFPDVSDCNSAEEAESRIRKWLKLRINWNNNIIKTLQNMITTNQKLLGLTTEEVVALTKDLSEGNIDSTKAIIEKNKDTIISEDHTLIDGKKIGLGCIIISDAIADDSLKNDEKSSDPKEIHNRISHRGWYYEVSNFWLTDTPITYMTKYDCTIVGHGGSMGDEVFQTDKDEKVIKDKNGDPIIESGGWIVEKVKTPKGHYCETVYKDGKTEYIRMNDLIRELILEGFKRINVVSCNPGGFKLPPSIQNSKKVLVRMSLTSTLIS